MTHFKVKGIDIGPFCIAINIPNLVTSQNVDPLFTSFNYKTTISLYLHHKWSSVNGSTCNLSSFTSCDLSFLHDSL
jgi:hypothetical protein